MLAVTGYGHASGASFGAVPCMFLRGSTKSCRLGPPTTYGRTTANASFKVRVREGLWA